MTKTRIGVILGGIALTAGAIACGGGATPDPHPTTPAPTHSPATPTTRPPTIPTSRPPTTPTFTHPDSPTSPSRTAPPSADMAKSGGFTCVDGTTSHAKHRQGACSHHGGVR